MDESDELGYRPEEYSPKSVPLDKILEETVIKALRRKVIGKIEALKLLNLTTEELQRLL